MNRIRARLSYKHTLLACYVGYLTQSLVINFSPLLFVTFMSVYDLSLAQVTGLITLSFATQLTVDLLSSCVLRHVSYRVASVTAHVCAVLGMLGFATLPELLPSPMAGLCAATVLGSIGGGIIEVILSPLVEACPTKQKRGSMSLLHSFYCWGQAATVLLSTLFFATVGIEHWRLLACLWAILPAVGILAFCLVPIYRLPEAPLSIDKKAAPAARRPLFSRAFVAFFILMICAGAAEQTMAQWASTFAEAALGVDKMLGDLLGPCAYALLMGISRVLYSAFSAKIPLRRLMLFSCILCVISYLLAAAAPHPILALIGCALCGLSVGVLWPGTYSRASERLAGGVSMFALLAFGGDVGCLLGPTLTGHVAALLGDDLRPAFLSALIFPVLIILLTLPDVLRHTKHRADKSSVQEVLK